MEVRAGNIMFTPVPDSGIAKLLVDKIYDKRKAAALDLEKYALPAKSNKIRHCTS